MLKGRLNNYMRSEMVIALLAHAYDGRQKALDEESTALRNEAIGRLLTPKQIAAVEKLVPLVYSGENNSGTVSWGGDISVNCGGPKITLSVANSSRTYEPIDGALPFLRAIRQSRLDLTAADELAVRVAAWAERHEELAVEMRVTREQVRAALAAFSTVSQMQASWPDAIPVVESIIIEHLGRPAPSLPAVVITEMNAKLGLPPANDTLELTEIAA